MADELHLAAVLNSHHAYQLAALLVPPWQASVQPYDAPASQETVRSRALLAEQKRRNDD